MNYIIDGHNLISKTPGLSLSMPDDEEQLIVLLERYGRARRSKVEVYFDGAPPGQGGVRAYGRVRAHFVPTNSTADEAIRARLRWLGKSASSWVVVTSDRSVQAAAHEAHAGVLGSEVFARQLQGAVEQASGGSESLPDQPLSPAEVDEWLMIFKRRKSTK
jgi:predicted RNA-binding protein with PIN domain